MSEEFKFNLDTEEAKSWTIRRIYQLGREYNWNGSVRVDSHLNVVATQYSTPRPFIRPVVSLEEALDIFYQQVNS
jgi:hypothetical protein